MGFGERGSRVWRVGVKLKVENWDTASGVECARLDNEWTEKLGT